MNEKSSFRKRILDFVLDIQGDLLHHSEFLNSLKDETDPAQSDAQLRLNYLNVKEYRDFQESIPERKSRCGYFRNSFYIWIEDTLAWIGFPDKEIVLNVPDSKCGFRLPDNLSESAILLFLRRQGYFPLHASGGRYNSNVLFAGRSGCGKSTLVYLLDKVGGTVFSDDRVFLRLDSEEYSCKSLSNTIQLFDDNYNSRKNKTNYLPEAGRDEIALDSFYPEKIYFPVFTDSEYPWIREIERIEAVMRLIPLTLPLRYENDLFLLKKFASDCSFYRLNLPVKAFHPEATMNLLQENC